MDLLKKTQEICEYYNIKPARSRGQNFLIRENIYDKIVEIADLNKDDVVLEVGPGLGFLTERLAKKAKKVIAVELDDKLVNILEERMKEQEIENVEVVNEDILKIIFNFQFSIFKQFSISNFQLFKKYKVVANLPYNITAKFLRLILSRPDKPESMTLMLQKEVAERIVAGPGKMSKLAVSVQFYASAKIIDYVGKENFWPEPKVDSAIIKITPLPHPGPLLPFGLTQDGRKEREKWERDENAIIKEFFQLVKYGFSAKRKMLKNNLAAGYQIKPVKAGELLEMADFRQNIRAQELSVADWLKLFGKLP